jgi:hypothetical protein
MKKKTLTNSFFHSEPVQKYYVFASFGKSQVSGIIYNLRVHNCQQQYWEIDRKQKTVNNCYIAIIIEFVEKNVTDLMKRKFSWTFKSNFDNFLILRYRGGD